MRSHIASSSGSSDDAITMAAPSCARRLMSLVNLGLGPNVDATCWLVEQEHLGAGQQALGERDFLLVSTGELVDLDVGARRLDPQRRDRPGAPRRSPPAPDDVECVETGRARRA